MTYTTLVAVKATAGSIRAWVNYEKLDPVTIVDEAQALIYTLLRVREMEASYRFYLTEGMASIALPARFLDPIGRIQLPSIGAEVRHKEHSVVEQARSYAETSGDLDSNPFTTTDGSDIVSVSFPDHGFNQDSVFYTTGASAFNGATIAGAFPIYAITDDDNFTIDISQLGTTPSGSGAGGGSSCTYVCDNLNQGMPTAFAVFGSRIELECAMAEASMAKLNYYRSLPLLSSSNLTNFLTDRYPQLMRQACVTAAADFMKDTEEYNKGMGKLTAIVQRIQIDADGALRGIEHDTMTP